MSAPKRPNPGCVNALQDDLGWALGVLFRAYSKAANAASADVPGGPRGYQVLEAVDQADPRSQLELASHLGLDRTVMTYLLDDLEKAGLIERRPDPADRRARRIMATPAAHELLCDLRRRLQAAENHVLAGLDGEQERRAFREMLQKLATRANGLDPVRNACELAKDVSQSM